MNEASFTFTILRLLELRNRDKCRRHRLYHCHCYRHDRRRCQSRRGWRSGRCDGGGEAAVAQVGLSFASKYYFLR